MDKTNRLYEESESDTHVIYCGHFMRGKTLVALAPDMDVASQGETIEETLANLKEALELYFEDDDTIDS